MPHPTPPHTYIPAALAHTNQDHRVIAFRLGKLVVPTVQPFESRVLHALTKLLDSARRTKWLVRVASGSFAQVFRIKKCAGKFAFLLLPTTVHLTLELTITHVFVACKDLSRCISSEAHDKLTDKLTDTAVRILKPSLKPHVFKKESAATAIIARLPPHPNLLQEQIAKPGMSFSRMYDENLFRYAPSHTLSDEHALTCIFSSLVEGMSYLHKCGYGHFDIKPSNILIKWAHRRGVFQGSQVVLADFGLAKKFLKNGTSHAHCHSPVHPDLHP